MGYVPKVRAEWAGVFAESANVAELATLTMPTLLLSGAQSRRPAQALVCLLRQTLPASRHIELANLGHMAPIMQPTAVNDHIVKFLQTVRPLALAATI